MLNWLKKISGIGDLISALSKGLSSIFDGVKTIMNYFKWKKIEEEQEKIEEKIEEKEKEEKEVIEDIEESKDRIEDLKEERENEAEKIKDKEDLRDYLKNL